MRDNLVMHDDFVSHVCMILQAISPKFTFYLTVLLLFFYLIYFEIRYLTAIIFDVTRIQYRQIIQILVQSD